MIQVGNVEAENAEGGGDDDDDDDDDEEDDDDDDDEESESSEGGEKAPEVPPETTEETVETPVIHAPKETLGLPEGSPDSTADKEAGSRAPEQLPEQLPANNPDPPDKVSQTVDPRGNTLDADVENLQSTMKSISEISADGGAKARKNRRKERPLTVEVNLVNGPSNVVMDAGATESTKLPVNEKRPARLSEQTSGRRRR